MQDIERSPTSLIARLQRESIYADRQSFEADGAWATAHQQTLAVILSTTANALAVREREWFSDLVAIEHNMRPYVTCDEDFAGCNCMCDKCVDDLCCMENRGAP